VAREVLAAGGHYGLIIKLLILTGQRHNEIGSLAWKGDR